MKNLFQTSQPFASSQQPSSTQQMMDLDIGMWQGIPEYKGSPCILLHIGPLQSYTILLFAGDASAYGIGAVISNTLPEGTKKPITFVTRSLSSSELNYAQLQKEALSLTFGVKKFHQYLYGRKFQLITDHKLTNY